MSSTLTSPMPSTFEPIQFTDNVPSVNVCNPSTIPLRWLNSPPTSPNLFNTEKKIGSVFSAFVPLNLRQESLEIIQNTHCFDEKNTSMGNEFDVGDIVQLKKARGAQYKYNGRCAVIQGFVRPNKKRAIVRWQENTKRAEETSEHNVKSLRKSPTSVLDWL